MKRLLPAVLLLLVLVHLQAQPQTSIRINVKDVSLSEVLLELKEKYAFQFAFDNDILSNYTVSVNRSFNSQDETISHLIKNFPLRFEKTDGVFVIMPAISDAVAEKEERITRLTGQVLESYSYEPLPFSYISVNNKYIQADQQGHFSFLASADSVFNLRISHLGYYHYDTVLTQSVNRRYLLVPRLEEIREVTVESNLVEKSTLIGNQSGKMKISHRIAPVIPGHGDNSVFNLLRLMPGILAAGEQSNDLLIWGGYESHSKIMLDGFTVFGLKNFNDNISVVNPFVVKDIEIHKGGYEALYGGRVGGIVDITGKNGTLLKPSFKFNINSTTVNGLAEVPLSERSSLLAAYRQTYYQLYDPTNLRLGEREKESGKSNNQGKTKAIDFMVMPDYQFRDANLKYSLQGEKGGLFYISLYGGGDKFDYNMEGEGQLNKFARLEDESNNQLAGSMRFSQPWEKGSVTVLTAGYSQFERLATERNEVTNEKNGKKRVTKLVNSENEVSEYTFEGRHSISLREGNLIRVGAGLTGNQVKLLRTSRETDIIDIQDNSMRLFGYIQNEWPVSRAFNLKSGIRIVNAVNMEKWMVEPRVALELKPSESFNINASWGLYNQFIAKTSVVDSAQNYSYFWTNSNGETIPVLHGEHKVAGFSYHKNGFTFSTEGFHKTTSGLTRFFNGNNLIERGFYQGKARSYGLDFYLKQEYKRNMAWISYTLSRTEEHFPFYIREFYRLAPHHQTHELKLAAIVNFKSLYLSANYVYGSGFERYRTELEDGTKLDQDYSRLDAALVYKLKPGRVRAEAGISVLNILDTENIKLSNLRRESVDEINLVGIYAEAVPFTPTLFFKIEF